MAWLPSLVIVIVVGAGYFLNRERLFEIARSAKNEKLFTPQEALMPRDKLPTLPPEMGDRLFGSSLAEAVSRLVDYALQIKPTWIVGVHPGGRLLSVLVADEMGLAENRCLYIRTNQNRYVQFVPPINEPLEGSLLLIDDVSRTGKTFGSVKAELIAKNYCDRFRLGRVYVAVLAVEWQEGARESSFRPDWARYRTDVDSHLKFPWSGLSARVNLGMSRLHDGLMADREVMDDYETLTKNYRYALQVARTYLSMDDENSLETKNPMSSGRAMGW